MPRLSDILNTDTPQTPELADDIESLSDQLASEFHYTTGLTDAPWTHKPLDWLSRPPRLRLAQLGAAFDHVVGQQGFIEAARRVLPYFINDYCAYGTEHLLRRGPLLIASNHPGAYDALIIAACLERDDLKLVSSDIHFLRALPHTSRYVLFTTEHPAVRANVVRAAIRHLQAGGVVLIYPTGHLDPDPEVSPGSQEGLQAWSRSVELMVHRAPETQVVVTVVSGVISPVCTRNPLTHIRTKAIDRQRVAEYIQVIRQILFDHDFQLTPSVSFAEPATLADLQGKDNPSGVTAALVARASRLLAAHVARLEP